MNKKDARDRRDKVGCMIRSNLIENTKLAEESKLLLAIIDAPDVYEPPKHEENWTTENDGGLYHDHASRSGFRLHGNEWPTERLAKIASLRIKITNYLGHIQYELCPDFVPDFRVGDQVKYTPIIDRCDKADVTSWSNYDFTGGIVFSTEHQAIEAGNRVKHLVDELNELIGGK